jgi:uncharacterized protein YqeY
MSLKQKIHEDFKVAFKAQKQQETSTIKMLMAAILLKEKDKQFKLATQEKLSEEQIKAKGDLLGDEEILSIVQGEIKKLKDALSDAQKSNRADLGAKAREEIDILAKYLPPQLSDEDLRAIVIEAIKVTGAKDQKQMGQVIKEVMVKAKGQAENSKISEFIKEELSKAK